MKKLIITIASVLLPLSAHAGFTLNQPGVNSNGTANASSISCTFASNPAPGDLVVVSSIWWDGLADAGTLNSVTDGNSNAYTVSNAVDLDWEAAAGTTRIAYLLSAPANANKTITFNYATTNGAGNLLVIFCDDFKITGGTAALDSIATSSGSSGASVVSPTIGVSYPNDLIYGMAATSYAVTSLSGGWSYGGGGTDPAYGNAAEYQLSASSNTALAMTTGSSPLYYDSSAISFRFVPTPVNTTGQINLFLGNIFKIMKGSIFMIKH